MDDDNQQQDAEVQESFESGMEQIKKDLDEAMQGWKRTAADFENYRRPKEAENKELVGFAREVTVAKLLPTLDSLDQALKHAPQANRQISESADQQFIEQYNNWMAGIKGILMQLDGALAELGVKKIEALGKKFDPNLHEAVREAESESEDGTVIDELQTGFELNGKVIRPSQVVIAKKK